MQINDSFEIRNAGNYRLGIIVPSRISSEVGTPNEPPLECILHIKIRSKATNCVTETVKSLVHEGQSRYGNVDFYAAQQSWGLKRGKYDIEIRSDKTPELITTHGAMLTLEQYERPVEWMLRHKVKLAAGLALSGIGLLGLLVITKK